MNRLPNKDFLEQRLRERQNLQSRLSTLFADETQAVLELGCGHGHFLTSLAAASPDALHVGVDKLPSRIARAQRKVDRRGLRRLHFIHADILDFVELTPSHVRWSDIYILFPDPWPKRRHHKHRWLQPHTLKALAAKALPCARLYLRTDVRSFFDDALQLLQQHPVWALSPESSWPSEGVTTVFESYSTESYSLIAKLR